jgi:hypothetical protein
VRRTLLALIGIVTLLSINTAAQGDKLTADETAWLNKLTGAGFTGSSSAGGVTISVRNAAIFSEHLKPVLAKDAALSDKQRAALLEFARLEVTSSGWIDHYPVEPGSYTVGLRQGKHNLQMVTRNAKGVVIDVDGAWLTGGVDNLPSTSATSGDEGAKLVAEWGDVKFTWTFVSREQHANAIGTLTERKAGKVSVFSDLPDEARIQQIADSCGKAVAANETLTGGKLPTNFRYELYLFGRHDAFTATDMLLTGGDFARNGAFTSFITGRSYIWYYTHYGENYTLPSSLLEVCIHELHHQFIYAAFPCMRYTAGWWQESLAEVAAQKGLELCDKQAAENYRKRRTTELDYYTRAGRMPQAADLLADKPAGDIGAYYTAAWTLGAALAAKPTDLAAMCALAAEHELAAGANGVLQREFDKRYASITETFEAARKNAGKDGQWFVKWNATVDERDKVLEVNTEIGSSGFALLNQPVAGNTIRFSGEFRYDDVQQTPQADFTFAYSIGAETESFIKLALLPAKVILFTCKEGTWTTVSTVEYETALEVTADGKPLWHPFKVTYSAETGGVRLETTAGRWAEFRLDDYWPTKGTYTGVGTYNGVGWFKGVVVS